MNIISISEIQVRITKCLTMALAAVRHFYNYGKCIQKMRAGNLDEPEIGGIMYTNTKAVKLHRSPICCTQIKI